ncbi:hypothetical protein [Haloferula sp.]|uniref:hypothetical protein n=1 Tax=Haloferula sp. TaxID=2497595 RepID=UPI00329B643F
MKSIAKITLLLIAGTLVAGAEEFRHIGDFIIKSRIKVTTGQVLPVAIKPLLLSAYTDGISVRISTSEDSDNASDYTIYRSDGIGRQKSSGGALEVVPGVQATSEQSGIFRQLRLTQDSLTITTFPGVSDQIVITHAQLAPPPKAVSVNPDDESTAER